MQSSWKNNEYNNKVCERFYSRGNSKRLLFTITTRIWKVTSHSTLCMYTRIYNFRYVYFDCSWIGWRYITNIYLCSVNFYKIFMRKTFNNIMFTFLLTLSHVLCMTVSSSLFLSLSFFLLFLFYKNLCQNIIFITSNYNKTNMLWRV